ncbi:MAG: GvpL/GvpF family gas vesicle protein, partial [Rhabdochlamydiaceae bacterium]
DDPGDKAVLQHDNLPCRRKEMMFLLGLSPLLSQRRRNLIYVYCVVPDQFEIRLESGFGFGPFDMVTFKDIAAVVSTVPSSEFNQNRINEKTKDVPWLANAASTHERVVEKVMEGETPIPMKLCTIFKSKASLIRMLKDNYAEFRLSLRKIEGKIELGVTAYLDLENSSASATREIKALKKKIQRSTPGSAYFLEQELDELISIEARNKANSFAKKIFNEMKKGSDGSVSNPLLAQNNFQGMILNASLLIEKKKLDEFRERFQMLRETCSKCGEITLKLTGPWPPYNFSSK